MSHLKQVFQETYAEVPRGQCRKIVKIMVFVFFIGWNMHTLFSTIGPEALNKINMAQYEIAAIFSDLVAKVTFCFLASILRVKVIIA